MGAGPTAHLHTDGTSVLHRMPVHIKLLGVLGLVIATVSIRPGAWPALAGALLVAAVLLLSTRVPARHALPRLAVDLPFVVFALVLPFVAIGPTRHIGPFTVSEAGLVGGLTMLAKATTGVLAGVAFAVTTQPRDLVVALQRLRLPDPLVSIVSFMVRYLSVVTGELSRMRIALSARGFRARSIRSWGTLAASAGALFVRSYERGERVHLAMVSRGYQGRLPASGQVSVSAGHVVLAALPALCVAALSLGTRV